MSAPTLRDFAERLRETLELDALEVDETGTLELIVDSQFTIRIQELAEMRYLVFTAGLGGLSTEKPAEEIYRALLQANFRGFLTVGGSLSLSLEATPEVELAVRESQGGMEYERFEAVLEDFIRCAEYWRDYLAGSPADTSSPAYSAEEPFNPDAGYVRL